MPCRGGRGGRICRPQAYWRSVLGTSRARQGEAATFTADGLAPAGTEAAWALAGPARHQRASFGRYWGGWLGPVAWTPTSRAHPCGTHTKGAKASSPTHLAPAESIGPKMLTAAQVGVSASAPPGHSPGLARSAAGGPRRRPPASAAGSARRHQSRCCPRILSGPKPAAKSCPG